MVNSESNGKVALITGANKGLGFEMSRQLAQQGLTVLIAARKIQAAEEAATTLRNEGLKAEPIASSNAFSTSIDPGFKTCCPSAQDSIFASKSSKTNTNRCFD